MTYGASPSRAALVFALPVAEWLIDVEGRLLREALMCRNPRALRGFARVFAYWSIEARRCADDFPFFVWRARALAWIAWMIRRLAREMAS